MMALSSGGGSGVQRTFHSDDTKSREGIREKCSAHSVELYQSLFKGGQAHEGLSKILDSRVYVVVVLRARLVSVICVVG